MTSDRVLMHVGIIWPQTVCVKLKTLPNRRKKGQQRHSMRQWLLTLQSEPEPFYLSTGGRSAPWVRRPRILSEHGERERTFKLLSCSWCTGGRNGPDRMVVAAQVRGLCMWEKRITLYWKSGHYQGPSNGTGKSYICAVGKEEVPGRGLYWVRSTNCEQFRVKMHWDTDLSLPCHSQQENRDKGRL